MKWEANRDSDSSSKRKIISPEVLARTESGLKFEKRKSWTATHMASHANGPNDEDAWHVRNRRVGRWENLRPNQKGPELPEHEKEAWNCAKEAGIAFLGGFAISQLLAFIYPPLGFAAFTFSTAFSLGRAIRGALYSEEAEFRGTVAGYATLMALMFFMSVSVLSLPFQLVLFSIAATGVGLGILGKMVLK